MTHIEQMIQDMCPNGVEFKKLGDLGVFENTGVDKKSHDDEQEVTLLNFMDVCRHKYIDASIPSMVVTAPDRKIEQCNVLKDDIFITPSSETIDEIGFAAVIMEDLPNVVYSYHIMRYRLKQPNTTTAKFIRYLFEAPVIRKQILKGAKGLTRFGLSKYQFADIEIPLPPLEIQKKIVECLDKFSALAAELQAELQMRRKQYEYYRTQLLTPHSDCNSADKTDDCNWDSKPLKDLIVSLKTGLNPRTNFKLNTPESNIPYITGKDIYDNVINVTSATDMIDEKARDLINKRACLEGNILLFASTGTGTVGRMAYVPEYNNDWAMSETLYAIKTKDVLLPRFLMHCLYSPVCRSQFENKISRGSVPHLKVVDLLNVNIPLPPIEEQKRLTELLDKFDKLTTSLEEGIPAEQIRQQKRYEYYRDLLLTFDRKAV